MRHPTNIGARRVLSFFTRRGAKLFQGDHMEPWSIDCAALERIAIRLLGIAEGCDDPYIRVDLMRIANDFSDVIENHQWRDNAESRDHEGRVLTVRRPC